MRQRNEVTDTEGYQELQVSAQSACCISSCVYIRQGLDMHMQNRRLQISRFNGNVGIFNYTTILC